MKTKKSYCLFILSLIITVTCQAQSIEWEVITPFGETLDGSSGMDLHCTTGEIMAEKYENGNILTQGFQQIYDLATPVFVKPTPADLEVSVYPNPATDWVTIKTSTTSTLTISLFDTYGRQLHYSDMDTSIETLNISHLAAGTYYLHISDSGERMQTYIIQKVNA